MWIDTAMRPRVHAQSRAEWHGVRHSAMSPPLDCTVAVVRYSPPYTAARRRHGKNETCAPYGSTRPATHSAAPSDREPAAHSAAESLRAAPAVVLVLARRRSC